jgi:hypothetical protein
MAYSTTAGPTVTATSATASTKADGGGKAVVAFISGLAGLLIANIALGPLAIGLGILALRDGTPRRGRAALGIALGVADLLVLAALALRSGAGAGHPTWRFGSF